MVLSEELKKIIIGDVITDEKILAEYSKDTSLFQSNATSGGVS